jgi:hypothetical protein
MNRLKTRLYRRVAHRAVTTSVGQPRFTVVQPRRLLEQAQQDAKRCKSQTAVATASYSEERWC